MPDPTSLTVYTSSRAGVEITPVAADANGNYFANTGEEIVMVQNDDVASKTVTIPVPKTMDGLAVTSRTVTVAAGKTKIIGPFPTGTYNDSSSRVNLTYSAVTDLLVLVSKKGVG